MLKFLLLSKSSLLTNTPLLFIPIAFHFSKKPNHLKH